MPLFMFSRLITKREPINEYGRMGAATHKEAVFINASTVEEAKRKIEPFNYKKHLRYKFEKTLASDALEDSQTEMILDLGIVESFEE